MLKSVEHAVQVQMRRRDRGLTGFSRAVLRYLSRAQPEAYPKTRARLPHLMPPTWSERGLRTRV